MTKLKTAMGALATLTLVGAMAGCATGNADNDASNGGKTITMGLATGWDEDIAVTYVWQEILEDKGYDVKLQKLSDNGPIFLGLARGDLDLYFDGWLPKTHASYWAEYKSDITDIGVWYDETALTLAVPDYVTDVKTIDDLAAHGDDFDNTIIGIEPGTGLMKTTSAMMSDQGLSDWSLKASSTASMLAALKKAIANEDPIVVTLWRPHWAYGAMPIHDLEDPNQVMGTPDQIHALGEKSFAKNFPDVNDMVKNFKLSADELAELEQAVVIDGKGHEDEAARKWLDEHPEFVASLG